MKKRLSLVILGIAAIATVCVGCGTIGSIGKTNINLTPYMSVEFSGYDGTGSANVRFDYDQFEADYGDKLRATGKSVKKAAKENPGTKFDVSDYDATADYINRQDPGDLLRYVYSESISPNTRTLSNGDTVTVTWNLSEYSAPYETIYNVDISVDDMTATVSGLTELGSFDPFDGLELEFSGKSPNGTVKVVSRGKDSACQALNYSVSPQDGLSNGDIVVVTAQGNNLSLITKYEKLPESTEKEYTVSGLPSYVTSSSEIPEKTMTMLKKQAEDALTSNVLSGVGTSNQYSQNLYDQTVVSSDYIGNYFLYPKNNVDKNRLFLIYKVTIHTAYRYSEDSDTYDNTYDIYWYCRFDDLLLTDTGECSVDISQYKTTDVGFRVDSGQTYGWWDYYGYESLGLLYNQIINKNVSDWNYEDNTADTN